MEYFILNKLKQKPEHPSISGLYRHAPTLSVFLHTNESTIEIQRFKLQLLTTSIRKAIVYECFNHTLCERGVMEEVDWHMLVVCTSPIPRLVLVAWE